MSDSQINELASEIESTQKISLANGLGDTHDSGAIGLGLKAALDAVGYGFAIDAFTDYARSIGMLVAFGPSEQAGLLNGGTLGAGLWFAPDGSWGLYGTTSCDVGWIAAESASFQVTFLNGGAEEFAGAGWAITVAGGEPVTTGVTLLFDNAWSYAGKSMAVGVGLGSPLSDYVSRAFTTTVDFDQAARIAADSFTVQHGIVIRAAPPASEPGSR